METHLRPRLEQAIMVTRGFIGRDAAGHTTTLGRGGSDYTATLLGEALHAARVDIWTDVAGIYTTDPRIAPRAKRIDHISFSEASDMAAFGAKVLHPATLLPAMRKSIPVLLAQVRIRLPVVRWCITPPTTHLAIVRLPCAVNERCCDYIVWRHNRPVLSGAVLRHFSSPRGHGGFGYNLREQYCAGAGRDSRYLR